VNTLNFYEDLLSGNDEKLIRFIESHSFDLENRDNIVETILEEVKLTLFEDMTKSELLDSLILVSIQNIQSDPIFDKVGMRFLLTKDYLSALTEYDGEDFDQSYRESFVKYIEWGVEENLLDERMASEFNLYELALKLKPVRDDDFSYIGLATMTRRYMVKNREKDTPREVPQFTWMRVAMGMSLKEQDPTKTAIRLYEKLSKKEYTAGGSTMIGAGTTMPYLANCFLLNTDDDIEHIFENIKNVALISKATGGIGMGITKLRAEGSPISSNNTFSSGPIPFANVMDATLAAIARAGKKKGAMALYMENWHINFNDFIDLRQNAGDDYRRTRTANTAVFISDEFMKRVGNDDVWYLFDPAEVPELTELYGSEFSKKYNEYIDKAEAGDLRMFKKLPAKEQYKHILTSLQSTSHPWLTWKDPINVRALNNNTGTIHNSNLCTEVCLPQDRDNIAVCNLAYVNLPKHIDRSKTVFGGNLDSNLAAIDWKKLDETVRLCLRHLDNLIDVGEAPVPEAKHADSSNRAVGLGPMGFAESLEFFGYAYDSEEAYTIIDRVVEFISYVSIDESCKLAEDRGAYDNFEGSMWSKGYVPYDTIELMEKDRGDGVKQNREITLDWDKLRNKVKRGVRNATTMMIAPNGNSSLTSDTSPGIDPRFALIFSRTTMNGKFLDINKNLVEELKKLDIWEDVRDDILERQGDISEIELIPQGLKDVFKTCFQISPYAFIEVASRSQKWIDQSMSRNMYLEDRDINHIMNVYMEAWKRGLKTTYYLHMKPRHTAEQSSVRVNKSKKIGKKGFGSVKVEKETIESEHKVGNVENNLERLVDKVVEISKPSGKGFGAISKSASDKVDVELSEPESVIASEEVSEIAVEDRVKKIKFSMGDACPADPRERALCDGCE
jgi:ribonucleoside-diphosphate reductase alpha chain